LILPFSHSSRHTCIEDANGRRFEIRDNWHDVGAPSCCASKWTGQTVFKLFEISVCIRSRFKLVLPWPHHACGPSPGPRAHQENPRRRCSGQIQTPLRRERDRLRGFLAGARTRSGGVPPRRDRLRGVLGRARTRERG
jgi:hypothetical protein